ncbi:MAG: hypothetical protein U1E36_09175 [Rickettsiales bacterium]
MVFPLIIAGAVAVADSTAFAVATTTVGAVLVRFGPRAANLIEPAQRLAQSAYQGVAAYIAPAATVATAAGAAKGALHMGEDLQRGDLPAAAATGAITVAEMLGGKFVTAPLATGCTLKAVEDIAAGAGANIYHSSSANTCDIVTHLPWKVLEVNQVMAAETQNPSYLPVKSSEPSVPIAR